MYQKAVQSIYQEECNAGNAYRAKYCKSISALIADKKEEARQERDLYAGEIAQNREACRETFKRTLGWPLTLPAQRGIPRTKQTEIFADAKVRICRMQFEIFPNCVLNTSMRENSRSSFLSTADWVRPSCAAVFSVAQIITI